MNLKNLFLGIFLAALFSCLLSARASEKEEEPGSDDPNLVGKEVTDPSKLEELLATEYNKRQSPHFYLETSYPMDAAKNYIRFCEQQYAAFLEWAGMPKDSKLWGTRCHVAVIGNKGEWEALLRYSYRHLKPKEIELRLRVAGNWNSQPPKRFIYSREGSTPEHDMLHLLHGLTHIFQSGLAGSGRGGFIPWLSEAFAFHRELELFGGLGGGCINFDTQAKQGEFRAWNDPDDWVKLLKREVKKKNDEDFILFWHKDLSSLTKPTFVKAWSLIQYFLRNDTAKADFIRFIKMLKTNKDQAKALKMVYNASPDDIDKEWRKWIKKQRSRKLTKGKKKKKKR